MELALQAVAKITGINLNKAARITRRDPLFNEEIQIEQELIYLEEAIKSYHIAEPTLRNYPDMLKHTRRERRQILEHCMGLIVRMIEGEKMLHHYTRDDILFAIHKIVSLVVKDSQKLGYRIEDKLLEVMKPYMTYWQRLTYKEQKLKFVQNMVLALQHKLL